MTLKRMMIILGILVLLASVGIAWLWEYAYSPEGRARVIIVQLEDDPGRLPLLRTHQKEATLLRWLFQHELIKPGFEEAKPPGDRRSLFAWNDWRWNRTRKAAEVMSRLGPRVLPIARKAVTNEDFHVSNAGIMVCGELRDQAAIQPILDSLVEFQNMDPPVDNGNICLDALLKIGPTAYRPMMDAWRNKIIAQDIPEKMAEVWGKDAVPYLIEMIDIPFVEESSSTDEDGTAAGGKSADEDKPANERSQATEDREDKLVMSAYYALARSGDSRASSVLVKHLDDPVYAWKAAWALGILEDTKAIPALQKRVHRNGNAKAQLHAASALARMGDREGVDYLLSALKSPDAKDRLAAAEQVERADCRAATKPACDALLPLLDDEDASVRGDALGHLWRLNDSRIIPLLHKLKTDQDENVKEFAKFVASDLDRKRLATQPVKNGSTGH